MLCFGRYCVERAQGGLLQPGGNQRLRKAGKSGKSGAKCGCHFLAVSRVAESATQSQLFPSSPATPPFLIFLSPSDSHSALSIYPSELDRSGTLSPTLSYAVGRCHLSHRPVESAWGRRHDRARLALPWARRATFSRSQFRPPARPGTPPPTATDPALLGLNLPPAPVCGVANNPSHPSNHITHFGVREPAVTLKRYALDYTKDYARAASVHSAKHHSEGQQGRLELAIFKA